MILCISALSAVICPFSLLILLTLIFSLFFLMSLANGLSILFTFSKNQLLVLLIFGIVSFVSFSFIYALIFMISFLLLTLQFLFLLFLVALGIKLGYLFDFSIVSWDELVLLSLPLSTAFTESYRFWGCCVFIFFYFYVYLNFLFYFFHDLLVIQKRVV